MLALSIRQPYAELILQGVKRIEHRTRPTRIVGQRFWTYASREGTKERRHGVRVEGEGGEWIRRSLETRPSLRAFVARCLRACTNGT